MVVEAQGIGWKNSTSRGETTPSFPFLLCHLKGFILPETNIAVQNGLLEYDLFLFGVYNSSYN